MTTMDPDTCQGVDGSSCRVIQASALRVPH